MPVDTYSRSISISFLFPFQKSTCLPNTEPARVCGRYLSIIRNPLSRAFSSTPRVQKTEKRNRSAYQDAYAAYQSRLRREANISRQTALRQQREEARGNPVQGIPTPFVTSFDATPNVTQSDASTVTTKSDSNTLDQSILSATPVQTEERLGYFVTKSELQKSLERSKILTGPLVSSDRLTADPAQEQADAEAHKLTHESASEAVGRIISLQNVNSMQRTRVNIQRVIDVFGRHNTDQFLKPKAPSQAVANAPTPQSIATPRAGPDVGSSEVQIGILTAKIRELANWYEGDGRKDKVNKRNLRLLLHRRQKLLKYMLRKERGSARWHHMVEKLGLTEATWKGQIELR